MRSLIGAPTVFSGRVYIGTDNGTVYALDAKTGCQYWTFKADAGVRNVTIGPIAGIRRLRRSESQRLRGRRRLGSCSGRSRLKITLVR